MLQRFVMFLAVWLALSGGAVGGIPVGLLAAAAATWVSLGLLPIRDRQKLNLLALVRLGPGFVWRSVLGGLDVAWRALHPRMPLSDGWLVYRTRLPAGIPRVSLGSEMSLLPGTLVAGSRGDTLYVHCLDTRQDVGGHLQKEERRIAEVIGVAASGSHE
jgi:multicomponent Na+:H+ antiporter subunit E